MHFIYDLLLNFNDELYDFYEWYSKDKVYNIRKIPIFKISTRDLYNITNYKCIISKDFLNTIYNKTFTYYEKIPYASLFTDTKKVIGAIFNNKGEIISFSSLLLDEEDEILSNISSISTYKLNYKRESKIKKKEKLRYTEYINGINKNYLYNLYKNKSFDEIEYLYRETTNKYNDSNIEDKYNELIESNEYKLYKIIKSINKKKLNNLSS